MTMSIHLYADETKENGFVLVAALVPSRRVVELRSLIESLTLERQRRIHFTKESPQRRHLVIGSLIEAGAETLVYDARSFDDPKARYVG
jgi:hypothetical protein